MSFRKPFGTNDDNLKGNQNDLTSGTVTGGGAIVGDNQSANTGTGGAWTNLSTYIDANKGQGAGIANAVTKKTQADVDAVGADTVKWQQDAMAQVDKNTRKDDFSSQIKADPNKVDREKYSEWSALGNYWGEKPSDASASSQDWGAYQSGYADINNKVKSAQAKVANANDYYGQQVLAKDAFGANGNYTNGMSRLDTFVARADESGKQAFQSFKDKNAGLGDAWNAKTAVVGDYAKGADGRGQAAYNDVQSAIAAKNAEIRARGAEAVAKAKNGQSQMFSLDPNTAVSNSIGIPDLGAYDFAVNDNYDPDTAYSDADWDALNALAGMDNDNTTNAKTRDMSRNKYWIPTLKPQPLNDDFVVKTIEEPPTEKPKPKAAQAGVGGSTGGKKKNKPQQHTR